MDGENQLIKQYEMLRKEILQGDQLNHQILAIVVGASALVLTAGFTQVDPLLRILIFHTVYVVTVPGFKLTVTTDRRTWRISTYLRTFVEPNLPNIQWESRLSVLHTLTARQGRDQLFSKLADRNETQIFIMLNMAATAASVLTVILADGISTELKAVYIIILVSLLLLIWWLYAQGEKQSERGNIDEKDFFYGWERVKSQEKDGQKNID